MRLLAVSTLLGVLIVFQSLAAPAAGATERGPLTASPAESDVNFGGALTSDGTFVGSSGVVGSVDTTEWALVSNLQTGAAPRFAPVDSSAAASMPDDGQWSALGSNGSGDGAINGFISAILVSGTNVYVGGGFVDAAGIPEADFLARWNGNQWSALGSNGPGLGALNSTVLDLAISGSDLYVAGEFTNAAGIAQADRVARWNGNAWSAMGSNVAGTDGALFEVARAVAVSGTDVFVGGSFTNVAGIAQADRVARWNGNAWSGLGSNMAGTDGAIGAGVWRLAVNGSHLYVGGEFNNAAGIATADKVARWTGGAWQALGSNGAGDGAFAEPASLVASFTFNGTDVYVGGSFENAAGIAQADYLARFDGSNWNAVGANGVNGALGAFGYVWDMAFVGSDLVLGGGFQNIGGTAGDHIIVWNGDSWTPLGTSEPGVGAIKGPVHAIGLTSSALYVGGSFLNADGQPTADGVAAYSLTTPQPDARIRKGSAALIGNDIYNDSGFNQSVSGKAVRGKTITFTISLQNDGSTADAFSVYETGAASTMYGVRYFRGTTEITSQVVNATYETPSIAPGANLAITVKVKVKSSATPGSSVTRQITAHSLSNLESLDAVKFTGMRK